jgi:hypothetical protein
MRKQQVAEVVAVESAKQDGGGSCTCSISHATNHKPDMHGVWFGKVRSRQFAGQNVY